MDGDFLFSLFSELHAVIDDEREVWESVFEILMLDLSLPVLKLRLNPSFSIPGLWMELFDSLSPPLVEYVSGEEPRMDSFLSITIDSPIEESLFVKAPSRLLLMGLWKIALNLRITKVGDSFIDLGRMSFSVWSLARLAVASKFLVEGKKACLIISWEGERPTPVVQAVSARGIKRVLDTIVEGSSGSLICCGFSNLVSGEIIFMDLGWVGRFGPRSKHSAPAVRSFDLMLIGSAFDVVLLWLFCIVFCGFCWTRALGSLCKLWELKTHWLSLGSSRSTVLRSWCVAVWLLMLIPEKPSLLIWRLRGSSVSILFAFWTLDLLWHFIINKFAESWFWRPQPTCLGDEWLFRYPWAPWVRLSWFGLSGLLNNFSLSEWWGDRNVW